MWAFTLIMQSGVLARIARLIRTYVITLATPHFDFFFKNLLLLKLPLFGTYKGVTNKYPQYAVRYILEEQKSSDRENIVAILILNSMV